MKKRMKKGFTLIELLAVIVLLAIIATIAVPIVINIIDDSKEKTLLISGKMYLRAVELAIADEKISATENQAGVYTIMKDGNLCSGDLVNNDCSAEIINIKTNGEVPSWGNIIIDKEGIVSVELKINNEVLTKAKGGELIEGYLPICKSASQDTKTTGNIPKGNFDLGDEYICDVNSNYSYHFFVLSVEDDKVNLILDRNINSNGTLATTAINSQNEIYSLVPFQSSKQNTDGPVDAMNFLYNATKDWTNIDNIYIDYKDEGAKAPNFGYGTIKTSGKNTTITNLTGSKLAQYENLKARLPKLSEVKSKSNETNLCEGLNSSQTNYGNCPIWLSNYLKLSSNWTTNAEIEGMAGYWTYSSNSTLLDRAFCVDSEGFIRSGAQVFSNTYGVRPVIQVLKDKIK